MAAGSIILDLLMRTGAFETDTKRAEKRLRELKKEARDAGKVIGLGLAAAGTAVTVLVKNAIDAADAAGKSAQAAGITVEAYTALAYAAELAGVEAGSLGVALNTLNKNISTNDDSLKQLGINVRTASGELKSADAVLAEIADRFAQLPEGPRRSQLALELFGKSGASLIPLLTQGSAGLEAMRKEAERLGVVIDTETARAAEQFNDDLTRMSKAAQGFGLVLAKEVLPTMTELTTRALQNAKDFGALRGAFLAFLEVTLGGTDPADVLVRKLETTRESIKGLQEQIKAAEKPGANRTGLEEMRLELAALEAQAKRSTQELVDVLNLGKGNRAGGGRGFVNPERVRPDAPDKPDKKPQKDKTTEAQRYLETLQKQGEATLELTELEKALNDIQQGRIDGLTPTLEKQILAQAKLNDENKRALELRDGQVAAESARARAAIEGLEALQQGNEELRREIELIGLDEIGILGVERARISSARAMKEELRGRRELAGESESTLQVLDAEIAALREREALLGRKIDRSIEERSKENAQRTGSDIRDTLAESIEAGILDGFRNGEDWTDVYLRELKAQFARTILRPLIQPVADAGNSILKDIIGAIGGAIGGAGYNPVGDSVSQTGEMIRGRRARGGDVHAGGAYLVGENGPEPFVPSTSGRIFPAESLAGRTPAVVIENHGARIEQKRDPSGDVRLIIEAAVAEVDRRIASGTGSTARAMRSRGLSLDGSLARRS